MLHSLKGVGTLRYSSRATHWVILDIEDDLTNYYRSLIPAHMPTQKPRYSAHCTVVRAGKEIPLKLENWGKYEGKKIEFNYSPYVNVSDVYYWLNVYCDKLSEIRSELGLSPKSRWTLPPEGRHQCFHITIANKKHTIS